MRIRTLVSYPLHTKPAENYDAGRKGGDDPHLPSEIKRSRRLRQRFDGNKKGPLRGRFATQGKLDRCNKPVAPAAHGFHIGGVVRRVSQALPQALNGAVNSALKVDEYVLGPKLLPQLLARHDFGSFLDQEQQGSKRQFLDLHQRAVSAQLTAPRVDFEVTDAKRCRKRCPCRTCHVEPSIGKDLRETGRPKWSSILTSIPLPSSRYPTLLNLLHPGHLRVTHALSAMY